MISTCSMNRIDVTMRRALAAALLFGALVAAPTALAQTPPATIEQGVTIQEVDVAGMTAVEAKAAVHEFATRPFKLTFRTTTLHPDPWWVGVRSHVGLAVKHALEAPADTEVRLPVSIDFEQLQHFVAKLDTRLSREPRDTHVHLRHLRPRLSKPRNGFDILRRPTRTLLKKQIKANLRGPVAIQYRYVKPDVMRWNFK